jgi:hypothetical protein
MVIKSRAFIDRVCESLGIPGERVNGVLIDETVGHNELLIVHVRFIAPDDFLGIDWKEAFVEDSHPTSEDGQGYTGDKD